jgi:hypothetical protein
MVHVGRHAGDWRSYVAAGIAFAALAVQPDHAQGKGQVAAADQKAVAQQQRSQGTPPAPAPVNEAIRIQADDEGRAQSARKEENAWKPGDIAAGLSALATILLAAFAGWQIWIYSRQTRLMRIMAVATRRAARAAAASAKSAEEAVAKADETLTHARETATDAIAAAKEANDISRDALEADSRPWVEVQVSIQSFKFTDNGADTTIGFMLRNLGKSPALKVWPEFRFVSFVKTKEAQIEITQRATTTLSASNIGITLFPNTAWTPFPIGTTIAGDLMDEVSSQLGDSKLIPLVLVGSVLYLSPSGKPHETGFIFNLMKRENKPDAHALAIFRGEDLAAYQVILHSFLTPPTVT